MNKLLCIRHGQTDWNTLHLMQGKTDIPINDVGKSQSEETKKLIDLNKIDVVYCSPLIRTRQTADIIVGDKLPIIYDDILIERSFGDLEGKVYNQDLINIHWNYKLNSNEDNVETLQDCLARAKSFIDKINKEYDNKTILVISHGCFIKVLHYCINGYDENTNFMTFFPENAKVYEYEI